ncbi:uncharacterized protein LOC101213741 [Cucumis sativus]|uniref:Transcriptional coactivator Hfi1/Transcriptional adapter 1 n=1 Tax=Cucumis sativus TaxID=3659 RepID=A0A0A0LM32_CUCSA|nr:uncharacterized protein LOC101213741 [Cucumis sativus]KGN62868.1 hypothetical protein Csa_022104 [Cucumis sativus]
MQPQQSLRIDLGELKSQIVKKLGADRSKRYFFYLNRFLSQKLSKNEFDKSCCRVLGRENLWLHNQLIQSILKNACQAKVAPPIPVAGYPKTSTQSAKISPLVEDGNEDGGAVFPTSTQNIPGWSNGVSPRKCRSGIRDRKLKDRPSILGPNGKVECISHLSANMDNGDATLCDYKRPVQNLQGIAELPENNIEVRVPQPSGKQDLQNKIQVEATKVEDREEAGQSNHSSLLRSRLLAPLGIPFCSASIGGARKTRPVDCGGDFSLSDVGHLLDTESLRRRMEQIAAVQGLGSVSADCANILNKVLDVYLKQLIRSCVDLVGAWPAYEPEKPLSHKQQFQGKVINGMLPNNQLHGRHSNGSEEVVHEHRLQCSISLLDFKVAMELNPTQLGEDWPLLLEKICMRTFGE